jgi:phosphomannomutase
VCLLEYQRLIPCRADQDLKIGALSESSLVKMSLCGVEESKLDECVLKGIREYVSYSPNKAHVTEIESLVSSKQWDTLHAMFNGRIAFGTAGLRAFMGPGYTRMNELVVLQTTQGLAMAAINAHNTLAPTAVVGYDARHNSNTYAAITARVLKAAGFKKVLLFGDITATPLVPFAVLQCNAIVGVMVTASHNPKQDNGYKVYWSNGAQIIPPNDQIIADTILNNLAPWPQLDLATITQFDNIFDEVIIDAYSQGLREKYLDGICQYSCRTKQENEASKVGICYTAMHGVGYEWAKAAFERFSLPKFTPTPAQILPDPEFPTVAFPNPEEGKGALTLAMEAAVQNNCTIILANDPDADRLAAAELVTEGKQSEWRIFSGNEIAALLADWVWQNFKKSNPEVDFSKCCMIASTVSSKFLQSMAHKEGFAFFDTLTGFKWMGNTAIKKISEGFKFLFAFEVEIGFLVGDLSFDKDGVRTAAIFAEMAEHHRLQGKTLVQHLNDLRSRYGYFEMTAAYFFCYSKVSMAKLFDSLRTRETANGYPDTMGDFKVDSIRDTTLGLDTAQPDKISLLPSTPKDQVMHLSSHLVLLTHLFR